MIPVLYSETERDYGHGGIGVLTDTMNYLVTEEANGEFELYLEYPVQGAMFTELKNNRLIRAKPNDLDDDHVFRIYEVVKDLERQTVYIYATSISNDLGTNMVSSVKIVSKTAQEALNMLKANLIEPTHFNFVSDITTRSSTEWAFRNPLNCIVGEDGSLVKYWGGEVKRTNDTVYLYARRGRDNVAVLREGKNLEGLEMTISTKGIVTKILPYMTRYDETTGEERLIVGNIVTSPLVNNYPVKSIKAVDYTMYDNIDTVAELNTLAGGYFTYQNPGVDKPKVSIDIDIMQLADSPLYSQYSKLESLGLFDSVSVYIPRFDVSVIVKVNKLEYNGLLERAEKIQCGDPVGNIFDDVKAGYTNMIVETEAKITNIVQKAANGTSTIFRGTSEPTNGVKTGDLWYKPIGEFEIEMYQWNGMEWELILSTKELNMYRPLVEAAIEAAEQAKLDAEQAYLDSVAEAGRLVTAQTEAFDAEMALRKGEITTVKNNIDAELARVDQTISDNFTSLSDTLDDVDAISKQAKSDAQTAASNAATALSNAQTAISTATSANNKAIKSSVMEWALSASGTTPPTTGWSTTIPTPSTTQYTWGRTTIALNDGTTIPSYNVSKMGVKGDPGAPGAVGAKGDKGDTGVNAPKITAVKQYFYLSSSNTSQTGGSWTETIPVWSSGKYYWTRVVTSYDNATTTESVPVLDNSLNQSLVTSLEAKSATQTLSTTVSQHATQIAAKASQTTVDSLTGRVSTAEGSISIQAGQIALKASQTSVDSLTGRVGTSETNISANATAINLRATKASVDTLTGRVSAAEASISVQAGKIDLAATKTELTTAINGIQVGGRNLVKNSRLNATSSGYNISLYYFGEEPLVPGEQYTISLKGTLSHASQTGFYININDGANHPALATLFNTNKGSDGVYRATLIMPKLSIPKVTYGIVYAFPLGLGKSASVEWIKIEKGNKATDWTPAPEDVDASIATVQSNLSVEAGKISAVTSRVGATESSIASVKQTADGNKATVANHAGQISTINQTVSGLQSTVASKADKSQITQLSNSISSVVTDLSNVDVIEQSGAIGKTFRNVHTVWNNTPGVSGMVRINTPITNFAMTTIRFTGYNYQGNRSTIDLTVSFYGYTASSILQHSYTNRGDFAITDVRVGRDSSGRAVILLGVPTTYWSYPSIDVEYVKISFMSPPDSWKDGWSSSFTTVTTGITALTTLQGMDTQSRITQNATNINLRVTKGEVVSQLNIDAGRVLIQTNKLLLDANTYIMGTTFANDIKAKSIEAVTANITSIRSQVLVADSVTSTHLKTEAALVNKIFATDAMVTTLTGKTAFINSVKAVTISADKITTGSLNATNVNIINMNANSIVSGTFNGLTFSNPYSLDGLTGTTVLKGDLTSTYTKTNGQNGSMAFSRDRVYSNVYTSTGSLVSGFNLSPEALNINSQYGNATFNFDEIRANRNDGANSAITFAYSTYPLQIFSTQHTQLGISIAGTRSSRIEYGGAGANAFVTIYGTLNMSGNRMNNLASLDWNASTSIRAGTNSLDVRTSSIFSINLSGFGGMYLSRNLSTGKQNMDLYATLNMQGNAITNQSDRRLKTNIAKTIENGLGYLRSWTIVDFNYIDPKYPQERQLGVIAQDSPGIGFEDSDGMWQVNSSKQLMILTLAAKEIDVAVAKNSDGLSSMDTRVSRLDTYVTQHELEIKNLKERIKQLEEKIA